MRLTNTVAPGAKETTCGKLVTTRYEHGNNQPRFRARVAKIVQEKNAVMRQPIAVHQSTDVAILADENAQLFRGLGQQGSVSGIRCPLGGVGDIVTGFTQRLYCRSDDVRVGQDAHLLGRDDETFFRRKLAQSRGVQEAGIDVIGFKNGIGLEHRPAIRALGEHGEHHPGCHTSAANNGFPAHFSRLGPDTRKEIGLSHRSIIPHRAQQNTPLKSPPCPRRPCACIAGRAARI